MGQQAFTRREGRVAESSASGTRAGGLRRKLRPRRGDELPRERERHPLRHRVSAVEESLPT